jgi:hypothetical protein
MNVRRNFVRLFVLALAATAISVGTSSAQDFQGKFTLPLQAQWGKVILQPGHYTMTLARFQGGQQVVTVRSEGTAGPEAMILTESENPSPSISKNSLLCIREGGALVVRSLEVAVEGETIYFHMPKGAPLYAQRRGEKQVLLAQGPQLIERVPVAFGSK